jgi:OOP family OmpA-OmpF porin
LNSINDPRGGTPLERQINADIKELKDADGQIAVIIISDGEEMDNAPIASAEMMKAIYGDRICIYTIQIGADPAGRTLLEQIAKAGSCGFYIRSDHLASNAEIADYVEKVFLTRKPAEGAKPFEPALPPPPLPPPLPPVVEEKQKAPEIIEKGRVTLKIEFDTAKAIVKPKYYDEIKKVTDIMEKYPDLHIVIEGHTDNVGGEKYNLKLSQRRAEAVKKVMETRFKIDAARLKAKGFGYSRPIASNKNADGRQRNRRVEAAVEYIIQN